LRRAQVALLSIAIAGVVPGFPELCAACSTSVSVFMLAEFELCRASVAWRACVGSVDAAGDGLGGDAGAGAGAGAGTGTAVDAEFADSGCVCGARASLVLRLICAREETLFSCASGGNGDRLRDSMRAV